MKISLERSRESIVVKYPFPLKTITSSFYNGGIGYRNGFFILSVPLDFNDPEPEKMMDDYSSKNGIGKYAGFITAVDLERNALVYEDENFFVLQTLGLGNTCIPGKRCRGGHTINTCVVYKGGLSMAGAMDLVQIFLVSRTYTLCKEMDVAGTSTDAFLLSFVHDASGKKYSGFATETGFAAGKIISEITRKNVEIWKLNESIQ